MYFLGTIHGTYRNPCRENVRGILIVGGEDEEDEQGFGGGMQMRLGRR
jgi:hypothetical protein